MAVGRKDTSVEVLNPKRALDSSRNKPAVYLATGVKGEAFIPEPRPDLEVRSGLIRFKLKADTFEQRQCWKLKRLSATQHHLPGLELSNRVVTSSTRHFLGPASPVAGL